ncbi:MAG: PP2C family serine/threonine-protein phosphatase, partial [Candidatus ainarchaeum sp.]|nr:PP2C family serine/threonine-protein phosphatase [Candidatus ainarchaeum sp.]
CDKTSAYLDFASAVALVDKGVRKRKATKASGSVYFREVYLNGKRGAVFGLFDGFDERGLEYLPSSLSLAIFKDSIQQLRSEEGLLQMLEEFMRRADAEISENVKGFCGSSAACGMVFGKKLYYANVGNNRIYGVKADGTVERLAGDEVAVPEDREQFLSELKYPYLYLGGFTQRMKGKKSFRVIHTEFRLKPPNIGTLDVSGYACVFVANSGVWKSTISMGTGTPAIEEGRMGEVFAKARNPLNAMERMDMQVRNFMKGGNQAMADDIAMLYFSI